MSNVISLICTILILLGALYFSNDEDKLVDRSLESAYDYIIVGAGSTGSVIANRLSENRNISVLLIEAGDSDYGDDTIRIPLMAPAVQNSQKDWRFYTVPQQHSLYMKQGQRNFWPMGKVLGGTSSMNFLAYVRGSRYDYDQWESEGCTGWSYRDVLPYFLKSEDNQINKYFDSAFHSDGGVLNINEPRNTELPDILAKAANEIGLPTVDFNAESQLGFSYMQSTLRNGERLSTARAFLRPILDRPNLHISINTMATKIIIDGRRVVGVEVVKKNRKKKVYVNKEVIVSAGTVNSPSLLMLSGIGPRKQLENLHIPVVADLPVGENLEDHYHLMETIRINKPYNMKSGDGLSWWNQLQYKLLRKGILSGSGVEAQIFAHLPDRDQELPKYPDAHIEFLCHAKDDGFIDGFPLNQNQTVNNMLKTRAGTMEFIAVLFHLHPRCTGNVRLNSKDPFDYPLIDPNYLCHKDDLKGIIEGVRLLHKLVKSKTLQDINGKMVRLDFKGICDKIEYDTDQYWECIIRHWGSTGYHQSSTCRMGSASDPTAVVDPELRVKGVTGLRVADASVMRHVPSGNTNAPCVMIGEKAADLIKGQDSVKEFRERIKHLKL